MSDSARAGAGPVETVTILARLWCRAEGNDPDDTISDAGHTVLDHLLSGQDRKSLAAVKEAAREIAALAAPAAVAVPEEVRRAFNVFDTDPGSNAMYWHCQHVAYTWVRTLLATPPSGRAAEGGDDATERQHRAEVELQEIADGAYGDNPMMRGLARDRLAAAPATPEPAADGAVPEGWRLVPVELTARMLEDGGQCLPPTSTLSYCYDCLREAWSAALAAAPKPTGGPA